LWIGGGGGDVICCAVAGFALIPSAGSVRDLRLHRAGARHRGFGGIGASMQLERARGVHPDHAVDGVRAPCCAS
jgi:POT family proton-dependent oligopeptide transporter